MGGSFTKNFLSVRAVSSRFFLIEISFSGIILYFVYFRCLLLFYAVLFRLIMIFFTHLPLVMALYVLHRLSQCIGSAMLMIWILESMFVKYNQCLLCWISCTMQVPVMSRVSTLYCYILVISQNNIEVICINLL